MPCPVTAGRGVALRSSAWKRRPPAVSTINDARSVAVLHDLRERDAKGSQTPEVLQGLPKMTAWLTRKGLPDISKHTVDGLMRQEGMNGLVHGWKTGQWSKPRAANALAICSTATSPRRTESQLGDRPHRPRNFRLVACLRTTNRGRWSWRRRQYGHSCGSCVHRGCVRTGWKTRCLCCRIAQPVLCAIWTLAVSNS